MFDVDVLSNSQIEFITSRKGSSDKEFEEVHQPQTNELEPVGGLQNMMDSLKTFSVMIYEVIDNHMAKAVIAGGL
jgi:hypothetical protein